MTDTVLDKLKILAESAKYDVSCSSSGTVRHGTAGRLGNTVGGVGICHSFTADGRCVSLLKIMLTNHCIFDCAYCVNRRTNDRPRATLSVRELVDLTIEFYRRNYIEGLFLSSGIVRNPDYTMERMVRVVKDLRTTHRFNGYIHLKSIPGCSRELVEEGGLYADRMSVNLELPTEESLRRVAPDKNFESVFAPMRYIRQGMLQSQEDRRKFRHAPRFVPAGQSTQIIVGATPETDHDILRENRLYQADWLMRFYGFGADEIVDSATPNLDLEIDPKLAWALRHPECFPVDINRADYALIVRVPGIGVKSARMIVASRRYGSLTSDSLRRIGVVMKKAQYFITCRELPIGGTIHEVTPEQVRRALVPTPSRSKKVDPRQLSIVWE